jgi:hypothetical protein
MTGYVIRGGKPGYDRLLLLARERWADARALLERAGISAGMRCTNIGYAGGEVTMGIARLVAPGGSVAGADGDQVKLAPARQAAAERRLGNVEFTALDVRDRDKPGAYDAVHARFLAAAPEPGGPPAPPHVGRPAEGAVLIAGGRRLRPVVLRPADEGSSCSWTPAGGC